MCIRDRNYAEGALGAIDSIENYLEMGVPAGQYTQVREEKKHSLEWYEALFAAVAAAIVAALPCFSVMRQYKMQKEHRQSLGFHMAYLSLIHIFRAAVRRISRQCDHSTLDGVQPDFAVYTGDGADRGSSLGDHAGKMESAWEK